MLTLLEAAGKSIDIDRLGVELELTLLQVTMSSMQMPMPVTSLNKPIKLVSKKFEIKNISFHLGRSLTNKNEVETLDSLGSVARQKVQISITCQKCGNQNQSRFSFCNICGTSIQSSVRTAVILIPLARHTAVIAVLCFSNKRICLSIKVSFTF